MRVMLVCEATEGGVRRHVRDLFQALAERVSFSLVFSCKRDPTFGEDIGVYCRRGARMRLIPMCRRVAPVLDLFACLRLIMAVLRERPDVIHAHSSKAGFLARLAGWICRVPVIYTPHVFPFLMRTGTFRHWIYFVLERGAAKRTAAVIVQSEDERLAAERLGYPKGRIYKIANGIAAEDEQPIRIRGGNGFHVGFFGRLCKQKGADRLPDLARRVQTFAPQIRFHCYGDGLLREQLERAAEAGVLNLFGGYQQGTAVSLMRGVDAVIVPSRWEGCPYVVLEAWAAGVPVLVSDIGGLKDLVRTGRDGLVLPEGDIASWAQAILQLADSPGLRKTLAENGQTRVRESFSLARMADEIYSVYTAIAQNGSAHRG